MREKVIPSRANPRYHYQVCRAAQLGRGEGGGEEERGMEWRGGEGRGGEGSSSGTGSGEWGGRGKQQRNKERGMGWVREKREAAAEEGAGNGVGKGAEGSNRETGSGERGGEGRGSGEGSPYVHCTTVLLKSPSSRPHFNDPLPTPLQPLAPPHHSLLSPLTASIPPLPLTSSFPPLCSAPTCPPVRALTPHLPVRALTPHLPASVRTHLPANVRTHLPASVRTHLAASRHEVQVTAGQPQKNVILVCHHVVAARG
ncbi:unnamed protein product [Closterium sp. NIES-64]|nr:unnamed protein product [Closterium sp. NIES-64]